MTCLSELGGLSAWLDEHEIDSIMDMHHSQYRV